MFKKPPKLMLEIKRSELAMALFNLRRRPLTFRNFKYMVDIVDDTSKRLLLKCGRQVAKSTLLSFIQLTDVIYSGLGATKDEPDGIRAIREVYVSPSQTQTSQFLKEKIRPLIYGSPKFEILYRDSRSDDDVSLQGFTTGAQLNYRAAFRDAERVRGIPADVVCMDEIQAMLRGNIPIILSCTGASPYARHVFTGTPLSESNQIEEYWLKSTQTEWLIPCYAHSPRIWNLLDIENIGNTGLICKKCGKPIDPSQGIWVDMVSREKAHYKGYHISQLCMAVKQDPEIWKADIVYPMENWQEDEFYNEILGISFGQADRPLTQKILKKASFPNLKANIPGWDGSSLHEKPPTNKTLYYAGVDWGQGRELASVSTGKKIYSSFTHLVIGAYDLNQRFRPVFWKKFRGKEADPEFVIPYIIAKVGIFGCRLVGVDYGFGWGSNSRIIEGLDRLRVIPLCHSQSLKELYQWDDKAWRMTLNRNAFISRLVNDIKFGRCAFPEWSVWVKYAEDFMAIYGEYSGTTNTLRYDHSVQEPDDGLHAFLYAKFVADKSLGIIPSLT